MASDRPDPGDFLEMAQRMLRGLFDPSRDDEDPWAGATRQGGTRERHREPSAEERRENLTFALATRAVEALEDLALNVAAIRQRLERTTPQEQPRSAPRSRKATAGAEENTNGTTGTTGGDTDGDGDTEAPAAP